MTKYSEKQVQKSIQKILFWGVLLSAGLLITGLTLSLAKTNLSAAGNFLIFSGLMVLLITPVMRVIILVYGYLRLGKLEFAVAAAAVFVIFAVSCLL